MANLAALKRELEQIKASINARVPGAEQPDDLHDQRPLEQLHWAIENRTAPSPQGHALSFLLHSYQDQLSDENMELLSRFVSFQFDTLRSGLGDGVVGTEQWMEMITERLSASHDLSHALRRTMGLIRSDGWTDDQQLRIRLWALRRRAGMQKIAGITRRPEPEVIITPAPDEHSGITITVDEPPRWGQQPAFRGFQGHATPTRTKR